MTAMRQETSVTVEATLRKSGDEYVITLPREVVEQLNLREGQRVSLAVYSPSGTARSTLAPDLREAFETEFRRARAGLDYLAEH